jgi:hypothetical protein
MKEKLSFILLFVSLYVGAKNSKTVFTKQDTINKTDSLGLKQGYWAQLDDHIWNAPESNYGYYSNYGELKGWEGRYINGKKIGKWKYYYGYEMGGDQRYGMWLLKEETYFNNGEVCVEGIIKPIYKWCLNSDTTKGIFYLLPDTFQINCKNQDCILSLYNKEVAKFNSSQFEIEIEKFLLGIYRRRVREINQEKKY